MPFAARFTTVVADVDGRATLGIWLTLRLPMLVRRFLVGDGPVVDRCTEASQANVLIPPIVEKEFKRDEAPFAGVPIWQLVLAQHVLPRISGEQTRSGSVICKPMSQS